MLKNSEGGSVKKQREKVSHGLSDTFSKNSGKCEVTFQGTFTLLVIYSLLSPLSTHILIFYFQTAAFSSSRVKV